MSQSNNSAEIKRQKPISQEDPKQFESDDKKTDGHKKTSKKTDGHQITSNKTAILNNSKNSLHVEEVNYLFPGPPATPIDTAKQNLCVKSFPSSNPNIQKHATGNKKLSKKSASIKNSNKSDENELGNNLILSPPTILLHSEKNPLEPSLKSDPSNDITQQQTMIKTKTSKKSASMKNSNKSDENKLENNLLLTPSTISSHSARVSLEPPPNSNPGNDVFRKTTTFNQKTSRKLSPLKNSNKSSKVKLENDPSLIFLKASPDSEGFVLKSPFISDPRMAVFQNSAVVFKKVSKKPDSSKHSSITAKDEVENNLCTNNTASLLNSERVPLEAFPSSDPSSDIFPKPINNTFAKKSILLRKYKNDVEIEQGNNLLLSSPPVSSHLEKTNILDPISICKQRLKDIKKEKNPKYASLCNLSKEQVLFYLKKETNFKWEITSTGSYYDKTQKFIGTETESKSSRYLSPKKFYDFFKSLLTNFFKNPSQKFLNGVKNEGFDYGIGELTVEPAKTKPGCPAVTLNVIKSGEFLFSMDFVPAIQLVEWPKPAENWSCNWIPENIIKCLTKCSNIGAEQKPELNIFRNKHVFLVAKLGPEEIDRDSDKCKFWQLSFGEIEKCIILHTNGKFYESSYCTKDVLKLLKQDVNELNEQLKTEDKLISSYHTKQLVFSVRSNCKNENDWLDENLVNCYEECLIEFIKKIRNEELPMFFIPDVNLLTNRLTKTDKEEILLFIQNKLVTIFNAPQLAKLEAASSLPEDVV